MVPRARARLAAPALSEAPPSGILHNGPPRARPVASGDQFPASHRPGMIPPDAPRLEDVQAAREALAGEVVLTPCSRSASFADLVSCDLWFKLENLQRTGSFKDRGALTPLRLLTPEERRRGVVTASAGNHAQAVAWHAGRLGIPARVVMPVTSPLIKATNTRLLGAEVVLHGNSFAEAMEEALRIRDAEGRVLIHAYDDHAVIAGQGTIALEILEQVPHVDTIVVPIGGGGVIAGIAVAAKALRPGIRIVGVEAAAAPSALRSREAGHIVAVESHRTLADGIAIKRIGERTFPLIEALVDEIVLVEEEAIARAILLLLERRKTVAEGAGAVPLAALISGRMTVRPDEVVVAVLCGGNIDVNMISRIIDRGLVEDGRLARMVVCVPDRPGNLARLTALVADTGANVLDIAHHRAFADISVGDVEIALTLETRGRAHTDEILQRMRAAGVDVKFRG
jgi:threonine dehydratase